MDLGEVSLLDTEPAPVEGEPPVRLSYALVAAGSQKGKDILFHDDKWGFFTEIIFFKWNILFLMYIIFWG